MVRIQSFGRSDKFGGNMILVEDHDTSIMLDFGEDPSEFRKYFTGSLSPRLANGLEDYLEFGILPNMEGLYRKDFLRHVGKTPAEQPYLDAVVISHAHRDHIKYIPFLRADIPIFCSKATKKVMEWIQEQRNYRRINELVELKKRYWFRKSKKNSERKVQVIRNRQNGSRVKREFNLLDDGETSSIGTFEITAKSVNHSIPGSMGYLIENRDSRIVYSGDFRSDLKDEHKTTDFIENAREFEPHMLITEATNAGNKTRENNSYVDLSREIKKTDELSLVNFNNTNLKRLSRVFEIAKRNDRLLAIKPNQAMLIRKLEKADLLENNLSLDEQNLLSYVYPQGWGMVSNKVKGPTGEWNKITSMDWKSRSPEDVLRLDYRHLSKEFSENYDYIFPKGIKHNQGDFVVFCDYPATVNLIDFQPKTGSKYFSMKQDSNQPMNYMESRIENWMKHFEIEMVKLHTPSHLSHSEIEEVVKEISADKVIPVHTTDAKSIDAGDCEIVVMEKGQQCEL